MWGCASHLVALRMHWTLFLSFFTHSFSSLFRFQKKLHRKSDTSLKRNPAIYFSIHFNLQIHTFFPVLASKCIRWVPVMPFIIFTLFLLLRSNNAKYKVLIFLLWEKDSISLEEKRERKMKGPRRRREKRSRVCYLGNGCARRERLWGRKRRRSRRSLTRTARYCTSVHPTCDCAKLPVGRRLQSNRIRRSKATQNYTFFLSLQVQVRSWVFHIP